MCDLSSPMRDQLSPPALEGGGLTTGPPRMSHLSCCWQHTFTVAALGPSAQGWSDGSGDPGTAPQERGGTCPRFHNPSLTKHRLLSSATLRPSEAGSLLHSRSGEEKVTKLCWSVFENTDLGCVCTARHLSDKESSTDDNSLLLSAPAPRCIPFCRLRTDLEMKHRS